MKSSYAAISKYMSSSTPSKITDKHVFMITKRQTTFYIPLQPDNIINNFAAGVPTIDIIADED